VADNPSYNYTSLPVWARYTPDTHVTGGKFEPEEVTPETAREAGYDSADAVHGTMDFGVTVDGRDIILARLPASAVWDQLPEAPAQSEKQSG
jgi:hypothetical protein